MDLSFAFGDNFAGVSFWKTSEGRVQASLKRTNGGYLIDYGLTPEQAWDNIKAQAGGAGQMSVHPIKSKKPRRDIEDLA